MLQSRSEKIEDTVDQSSSDEEKESFADRKAADVRLAQLKKIANKKRTHGAPMSRLEVHINDYHKHN